MNKDVRRVLTRARDLISQGWVRGNYAHEVNGKMCFCAVGAIRKVTKSTDLQMRAVNALATAVGVKHSVGVIMWNDTVPSRDKRYIIRGFNKAIKLAASL